MPAYIHQLPDWPKFRWSSEALEKGLADVHRLQDSLLRRMERLGSELRAEATLQNLTDEVIKSSEIEGERLDRNQVRSSIARRLGIDIGGLTPADRNVEGVVEMMLDATQNYAAPLMKERLLAWHAALFPTGYSGMTKIIVGAWRDDREGPMQVFSGPVGREKVHYEAPAAVLVDKQMDAFLGWFERYEGMDLVLKAGIAHLWAVTIHGFADGNGRIARAIADLMLARAEKTVHRFYSMSAQIQRERNDYYDILEATQKGELDITCWLEWFLGCLARALISADAALAGVLGKAQFWERHADTPLNERQRKVLNCVLDAFEGKLTTSKWAKIATCSHDTALRDIEGLVKLGILVKNKGGGRSTSYSLRPEAPRAL